MKNSVITDRRGFIVILLAAALMVLILGFAGLAIDVGRGYYVKGEVQNAADAAALAGAGEFVLPPDFAAAKSEAVRFVGANQAAGANLTAANAQVEAGYWDSKNRRISSTQVCAETGAPCTPSGPNPPGCTCGVLAVQAMVRKPSLYTSFGKVFGWYSTSAPAKSVAARRYPTTGKLSFPFAVTKCMTDYYMQNNLYGQVINIPQSYAGVSNCNTGNWSSLGLLDNSDKSVQGLLDGTIGPLTVGVGDQIKTQPGTKANLFQQVQDQFLNKTILIPVALDNIELKTNTVTKVAGFMEFTITGVQPSGSDKYISGIFKRYYEDNQSATGMGGAPTNTLSPPALMN